MTRRTVRRARFGFALILGLGLVALPGGRSGADDKNAKPPSSSSSALKGPDYSAYLVVGDVVGEVVKADDKKLTLRVTWFVPQQQGGSRYRRPPLHMNPRNFRNPYGRNMSGPRVTLKEQHHDYELEYVPETLVRNKAQPTKADAKGKQVLVTGKELERLRAPINVPGYSASAADLAPGTVVEVVLIRDKTLTPAKVTEDDLRVKYALILGTDPNPKKDLSTPGKDGKKN